MNIVNVVNRMFGEQRRPDPAQNNKLIEAIEDVKKNDGIDTRERLYKLLLDAIFWIPTPEIPSSWLGHADVVADGKTSFKIIVINKPDGKQITPVFTDEGALRNWDPNTPSLRLRGLDYFMLAIQSPIQEIVINPFDPIRKMIRPGRIISQFELESLAKGELPKMRLVK